jgi:Sulfotransferase domain
VMPSCYFEQSRPYFVRGERTDGAVREAPTAGDSTARDAPLGSTAPVRVLYIGGLGRSGSTLLDLMLGEVPGLFPVGELRFIWERGVVADELCGCGAQFRECPFWTAVGIEAFGGWDAIDPDELVSLKRTVDRHRFLPYILFPFLNSNFERRLHRYAGILARLYRAIAKVSGASVVVDSTKDPPYAFLLRRVPGIDVSVVHLVRDSRGVAYSWTKHVRKPEAGADAYMHTYRPVQIGLRWLLYNLLFHLLGRLEVPRLAVRYEHLVDKPREELADILAHVDEDAREDVFSFLTQDRVDLNVHHTVAGNPLRFRRGELVLRVDDEWRTRLSRTDKWAVFLVTWPLLFVYGYLGRYAGSRSRGRAA